MHGNVWELCQDYFDWYPGGIALDPQGPETGPYRVVHGGSYLPRTSGAGAAECRSASRDDHFPSWRWNETGFRVVLAPGPP